MISALAVVGDHLIVGYRVACGGDPEGAGHASMLFDCDDTLGASAGPMSCVPILDDTDGTAPLDVRDIEVVPEAPLTGDGTLVLYVADGGRRWDGADTTAGEGTVYEVRISPSGGYTVADTDTQAALPTWAVDAAGTPVSTYRTAGNCGQDSGDTLGDLVSPEGDTSSAEGRDLVTILLTPEADALFAFYPQDSGERDYGCVRVFRAPLDGTLPLAWTPFQGWEGGAMKWESLLLRNGDSAGGKEQNAASKQRINFRARPGVKRPAWWGRSPEGRQPLKRGRHRPGLLHQAYKPGPTRDENHRS